MHDLPKLIRYFRDCYEADNRDLNLWDVFHGKVEHRYFVPKEEELLTGHLPILPLPEALGKEVEATLTLYEREKELYHMSFLLLAKGYSTGLRGDTIVAPLLLHPATLESTDGEYYVRTDLGQRYLNTQVVRLLQNNLGLPIADHFGEMQQLIPDEAWELGEVGKLKRLIHQWLPTADTEALLNYPQLFTERKVKSLYKNLPQGGIMVVPASLVGITAKGENTRSIINDLEELCSSSQYSTALQALFAPNTIAPTSNGYLEIGHLPVLLNAAQQQIMQAANIYPVSQITGPPGTGKSYTIAALAVELASKGQKVLIASRTDAAVDVIFDKIERDLKLKDISIRGGRRGYNRRLIGRLTGLLSGMIRTVPSLPDGRDSKRSLGKQLDEINSRIKGLETAFNTKVANEMEWGQYLAINQQNKSLIAKFKQGYISLRNNWQESLGANASELDRLLDVRMKVAQQYIKLCFDLQVAEMLHQHRQIFSHFSTALRSRGATANEQQLEKLDSDALLSAFPIWLVNISDLRKVLPMKMEMFDVAIIDEATQCDTASFLPLLQRAKRVVVAGDPKQLRHVSFLSYSRQKALMDKHSLPPQWHAICNYRDVSLLDVVSTSLKQGSQVSFLNEHYRSTPPIIQFSNQEFYDRQLNIMTEKPGIDHLPSLFHHVCDGLRNEHGCNQEEGNVLIATLEMLVAEDADLPPRHARSFGILSPFRKQADYLAGLIAEKFDSKTISRHRIMIGTAYSFQGAERDVMLLSLAVDHNAHHSAFGHVNKPDVFNVSITRARIQLHVYSSVQASALGEGNLLRQYLEYIESAEHFSKGAENMEFDHFQEEVAKALAKQYPEADIRKGYTLAGLEIDIVLILKGKVYGIDLIGYPGQYQDAFSLERYRMYRRAGVHLFPLAYSNWVYNRKGCNAEVKAFLS